MTTHPERIAGYRIVRVLDPAPNFADVFLGEPEGGNAAGQVVIKWVRRLDSELEREVADREMKIGVNLEHPNIARLLGYGTWGERPYLVTEYLAGGTLQSLIEREGPLSWQQALEITAQVCSALGYAHSHEMLGTVVHRDLTPDNILFDATGRAKVIDYGIASAKFLPSKYGRSFAAMGKPRYMSLEQMTMTEAGAATPAMDIFSLGAVLYEMLTKELPYGGDAEAAAAQVAVLTRKGSAPGPKDLNRQIPGWLNDAVKKALSPDPPTRWGSVEEFGKALRLEAGPQEEKPAPVAPKTRPEIYPQRDAPVRLPERDQNSAERKRIIENAERGAKGSLDWVRVAERWKQLGEDAEARRCLAQAERLAVDARILPSRHWVYVAKGWIEIFGDEDEASRCLTQAEKAADDDDFPNSYDWVHVAKGWTEIFGDEHGALRCLVNAETAANHLLGWTELSESWKEIFDDEVEAGWCLTQAEEAAERSVEWAYIAHTWKRTLADDSEARRCLAEADKAAKTATDWAQIAEAWKDIFDDETRLRKYVAQAEKVAKDGFDWIRIAECWEHSGETAQGQRCRRKAEEPRDR